MSNQVNGIDGQRAMREVLLADRHRPGWHFVSPEGHCMPFDPNGAIYWKGRYHLCYIFQDARGHCWGHASSADLLHWQWHEPALAPGKGEVDQGIFSGNCFLDKEGKPTIMYHGLYAGNCVATAADDKLDRWTKFSGNPIVPNPAEGSEESKKYNSWDPHGWVENGTYYAVFGGNPSTCVPPALFKADEMGKWKYVGPFMTKDMPDVADHEDVSCPDFFELGGKHVLVCISHSCGARYYVGRWENERFHPEIHRRMNWPGGTCFAPESLLDDKGRRIMWTWALERRPDSQSAWGGTMTLPRVLSMGSDGTLLIDPAEELERLRCRPMSHGSSILRAGQRVQAAGIRGDSLELTVRVKPGSAKRFGVDVRRSPDGAESTGIWCDFVNGTLGIDTSRSSLDKSIVSRTFVLHRPENPEVTEQVSPFELKRGESLELRVFLDRSILEVFANRRQCVTQRIYPTREDSVGVELWSEGGECVVEACRAWEMSRTNAW